MVSLTSTTPQKFFKNYRKVYLQQLPFKIMDKESIERIKAIIEEELERDFNTKRLKPYSRFQHLKEHIFWKIDNMANLS